MGRIAVLCGLLLGLAETAGADTSKLEKEGIAVAPRGDAPARQKLCCGYPLVEELGWALRFYWMAQQDHPEHEDDFTEVPVYTQDGFFLGSYADSFYTALRMEGSGRLADGRVLNFNGRCNYGEGTCFEELDQSEYPYGRGAGSRPLVPFKSVAVDPRLIPIGDTLYIPELDGLPMPDGQVHDGCVRADDTGGSIKQKKMDFFVVSKENFRAINSTLAGVAWITPQIEHPRCDYLHGD